MLPLITLEEHYVSRIVREAIQTDDHATYPPHVVSKLGTLGDERIQDLDNGSVSLQVISHGPGDNSPAICSEANDDLASAISKHPIRLAGFAMLPMSEPAAAAKGSRALRFAIKLPWCIGGQSYQRAILR